MWNYNHPSTLLSVLGSHIGHILSVAGVEIIFLRPDSSKMPLSSLLIWPWASLGFELQTIFLQNSEGTLFPSSWVLLSEVLILTLWKHAWMGRLFLPSLATDGFLYSVWQGVRHGHFIGRLHNSPAFSLGLSNFDRKVLFIKHKTRN